jgi:hypothetical protein
MHESITVRDGDSTSSLAYSRGLLPDTVWNHSDNAKLKSQRADMNALQPGDVIVLPDKDLGEELCATDAKHSFRRKAVPALLRIKFFKEAFEEVTDYSDADGPEDDLDSVYEDEDVDASLTQEPRADCPYRITIDGIVVEGKTDADGLLEESIPPDTRSVRLILDPGVEGETTLDIAVGTVKAHDELPGIKERLANIGYDCGDRDEEIGDVLPHVLSLFQSANGLKVTGKVDDPTINRIKELHGS